MVMRGKPAAIIPIKTSQITAAAKYIEESFNLRTYAKCLTDEWATLWIYKDEYLVEVIKSLPEKPKTVFDHWVLGKVFGYTDEAIKEFVTENYYLKSVPSQLGHGGKVSELSSK